MKQLLQLLKHRTGAFFLLLLLSLGALVVMMTTLFFRVRAGGIGASTGEALGHAVGTAIGSADGLINGLREGGEAGTAAGLSAADTTVDLLDSMNELAELEVLTAGVTLRNVNKVGNAYANLSIMNGDAVFTVDMTQAHIRFSHDGKEAYISIPEPELALFLDQSSSQVLFEAQKFSFDVSAEDGLQAYLNSMAQTASNAKETIASYDSLVAQAKESALHQVEQLAKMLSGDQYTISVQFQ